MRSPVYANFGLAESTETSIKCKSILPSFRGEKVCFQNAKKCIEEALDSLNIRRESGKIILKEEQERAVKELISGNYV